MAKPSARLAPAPPSISGTQASGRPASANARHNGSFQAVVAGAIDRLRIGKVGKNPRRRFGDNMIALGHHCRSGFLLDGGLPVR